MKSLQALDPELHVLRADLDALSSNPQLVLAEAVSRLAHWVEGTNVLYVQSKPRLGVTQLVSSKEFASDEQAMMAEWIECLLPFVPAAETAVELEVGRVPSSLLMGWAQYLSRYVLVKSVNLGANKPKALLIISMQQHFSPTHQAWVNGVGELLGQTLAANA